MSRRPLFVALLALFFLSGACGLVYEVIWVRLLTVVFGTSTFAVSALLTSFMAGLGVGSFLAGRHLAGRRRPLAVFGLLEWGVGLYALALPFILPLAESTFLNAASGVSLGFVGENVAKLLLSMVILLPPTALMGASLPVLAQIGVTRLGHLGTRVGSLYALNTAGAVVGCFVAGFYAIPTLGVRGTTLVAAVVNFAVGASAFLLQSAYPSEPAEPEPVPGAVPTAAPASLLWVLASFFFSGCAALGFEVVWTRLIALTFKGFTYSFSTMLTVFLGGIALGSLISGRIADRSRDPLRLLGGLNVAIGLVTLATAPLWVYALDSAYIVGILLGSTWRDQMMANFIVAGCLLIGPTLLFGATFPVVSRLATLEVSRVGATVGRLYAANVLGSILGASVTGFVLIPILGTHGCLELLSIGLMLMGGILVLKSRSAFRSAAIWIAVGASAAAVLLMPDVSRRIHEGWLLRAEQMTFYHEGATATVMVGQGPTLGKRILVSGSSASNASYYGLSVNRIQGTLPFLFEKMPRRVLAICFGTGITFGTLTQFELERLDGVDIAPEVFAAAPRFSVENYDVVASPRVRLHVDDGRNFLLKSRDRYDAITMEPMPPALAGVVNFYTRDFYDLAKNHLEPGGVVSQWVPLYYLGPEDVKILYHTFAESFPYAMVFFYQYDTFMVGSDRPLDLSGERFEKRLSSERLARDLETIGLRQPREMLGTFLMGRDHMLDLSRGAPVLTDDFPIVEFTAPKAADMSSTPGNYLMVTRFAESARGYLGAEKETDLGRALDRLYRDNVTRWKMARHEPLD